MEFMVKLIEVRQTKNEKARRSLQDNCTHVANHFWLFEGEEFALDDDIIFHVVGEQAIESYGDYDQDDLKRLAREVYNVDRCFLR